MTATLFLQCFIAAQLGLLGAVLLLDCIQQTRDAWGQP